jgi:hypothetical protein
MLKNILLIIFLAVSFLFVNCQVKGTDNEIKDKVTNHTSSIQALVSENTKLSNQFADLPPTIESHRIILNEQADRILALETTSANKPIVQTVDKSIIKKVAKADIKKMKKTQINNAISNDKKSINIEDEIAGYGEVQNITNEINQPATILTECNTMPVTPVVAINKEVATSEPVNLIKFLEDQKKEFNNSLEAFRNKYNATDSIVSQQATEVRVLKDTVEQHDVKIKEHDNTLSEQRKTLTTYNNELQQLNDFKLTSDSRIRVLENNVTELNTNHTKLKDTVKKVIEYLDKERQESNAENTESNNDSDADSDAETSSKSFKKYKSIT